ncbi:MAG: 3-dehydroquinate synthase, partial [Luteolibacter sp.]
ERRNVLLEEPLHVDLAGRSYDVLVDFSLLGQLDELLRQAGLLAFRPAVISDENVAPLYAESVIQCLLLAGCRPTLHTVPAGESSKSMTQAESLCREMIQAGHDRHSMVIALGGGVVGDLAGFVSAIFYRGLPFVQIPTTIVSQVDSSVGGKTGVNVAEGKNLLGAFHQPRLVVVDPATLQSLPGREFREGFAEAIKHAAIRDARMLDALAAVDPQSREVAASLIADNIAIKARIVEADEHETRGQRALLNFGHTIGHGIEAALPYGEILHGEAISLGIRAALFLSERHADLNPAESAKLLELLRQFSLPLQLPSHIDTETVMTRIATDKKFSAGQVRYVVLSALGEAHVSQDITKQDIRDAIEHLRQPL